MIKLSQTYAMVHETGYKLRKCSFYFRISQILALGQLMKYYMPGESTITKQFAYVYASVIALSAVISSMTSHNYMHRMQNIGMCARVACCSLIYRKSLKLSNRALLNTTTGKMVNLLSNDINRFDRSINQLMSLIMFPVLICIVTYTMYAYVGMAACAGIVAYVVYIPLQGKSIPNISEY